MENNEEKTYQSHRDRIPESAALDLDIVPVEPVSTSSNGPSSVLPTSADPEAGFVDGPGKEKTELIKEEETTTELIEEVKEKEGTETTNIEEVTIAMDTTNSMEVDESRGAKRKKSMDRNSTGDSDKEEEEITCVKVSRKQRIIDDDDETPPPLGDKRKMHRSNPNITESSPEEEARIVEMKKGYISKKKELEIEDAKEKIATEKREEIRRKREERIKAEEGRKEEEKRKKEERAKAETSILGKIRNKKGAEEKEYIENMPASDVAAMALEYLDHIETIRTKCGTMQGGLSKALKERKLSLDTMIKTLLTKAEEKGDPHFLKAKIEELLKKKRKEEDKKRQEINELKETVMNLTKENKEMREELKLIRVSLESRNLPQERSKSRTEDSHLEKIKNLTSMEKEEDGNTVIDTHPIGRYPAMSSDVQRCPVKSSDVPRSSAKGEGPVMRPPIQGRSAPIPKSDLKQINKLYIEKINKVKDKIEEGRKKPVIKVKENIQIRPPRNEKREVGAVIDSKENKERDMEWEVSGTGWDEEDKEEEEAQEDRKEEPTYEDRKKGRTQEPSEERKKETARKMEKEEEWIEVSRSRGKGITKQERKDTLSKEGMRSNKNLVKEIKRKIPKTAAVSIKGDTRQGFSYAEALRKARSWIRMEDLDIEAPRIRKGLNGATIIEISGAECISKAQKLAHKLQEVLKEENAAITTPTIKGDLRIAGLDESIGKDEIGWAIEEEGGCDRKEIRIGDIKRTRRGLGIVWVQCPLKAAIAIAKKKKIKIGWTIVGATLLKARPLQCFRCWHHGHVKEQCRSKIDRSKLCFQCGKEGHGVNTCNNSIRCAICTDLGREDTHRVGSVKCEGVKMKNNEEVSVRRIAMDTIE